MLPVQISNADIHQRKYGWACFVVHCPNLEHDLQVLASSGELLKEAWHEIEVMRRVSHPNIMPLLSHATVPAQGEGGAQQCIYMLMPLYEVSCHPSLASAF